MSVVLYTREGCHLCDEAREKLLSLRDSSGGFELREVDIDTDDDLHARFLERIPVVEVDGDIVAELDIDPALLRAALAERRTSTVRSVTHEDGSQQL
jgi:glutaredoxin